MTEFSLHRPINPTPTQHMARVQEAVARHVDALNRTVDGYYTISRSHCLYCGRSTPHEVCHEHSEQLHPGWYEKHEGELDQLWDVGPTLEPEVCTDPKCPLWED